MSTRPYIFAIGREDPQNSPVPAALPLTAAPPCAKGSGDCCTCERRDPDRRGGDATPQLSGHDPDAPLIYGRARMCDYADLCTEDGGGNFQPRTPPAPTWFPT